MTESFARFTAALANRYRIERELGQGGMATVYLAHDVKHGRNVALKVLHEDVTHSVGADRFLREIHLAARLNHPNIIALFDSGEIDGVLFYVMPAVDGQSLRELLKSQSQLPIEDAVRIVTEVASALDHAHRHGVVHRDIKPENILLHDGHALVADFGIGKALSDVECVHCAKACPVPSASRCSDRWREHRWIATRPRARSSPRCAKSRPGRGGFDS